MTEMTDGKHPAGHLNLIWSPAHTCSGDIDDLLKTWKEKCKYIAHTHFVRHSFKAQIAKTNDHLWLI